LLLSLIKPKINKTKPAMLYRGNHITASQKEILHPVSAFEMYKEISKTGTGLEQLVKRIRKVARIDQAATRAIKKQLPYFTGSSF